MTDPGFISLRGKPLTGLRWFWRSTACLILACFAFSSFSPAETPKSSSWHNATESELQAIIPARAPVVNERIETELHSASGITDGKGHFVAGVVLITAGYSAEGKYSHYFIAQVPIRIGDATLAAGQYLIGWTRGQSELNVTFYDAITGKAVGHVTALRSPTPIPVEEFRIWPPKSKSLIQLGRFTFAYTILEKDPASRQ